MRENQNRRDLLCPQRAPIEEEVTFLALDRDSVRKIRQVNKAKISKMGYRDRIFRLGEIYQQVRRRATSKETLPCTHLMEFL